ncbi:MAG: L,D-transpeptidase [Mesorhizobium sp.]|nr:MAG: L,D-transpeptidase [Mesorhizobium sp.]RWQ15904.1 MAG: L,D-transpeptidase [Mesorhizobium sp.]
MRALLLAASLLLGTSCTSTFEPGLSKAELANRRQVYAIEAYPVKIVDRRKFDPRFRPAVVAAPGGYDVGTIVVNTHEKLLYLIRSDSKADRYGIAVGAAGYAWKGTATVARKAMWPAWYPTDEMKQHALGLPERIPPGESNPLGARALYLYQGGRDTLYRIHGTSEPWTIGTEASSGCIRLLNEDIIDLYSKVPSGAAVIVL